jgi:hypothetical protein
MSARGVPERKELNPHAQLKCAGKGLYKPGEAVRSGLGPAIKWLSHPQLCFANQPLGLRFSCFLSNTVRLLCG